MLLNDMHEDWDEADNDEREGVVTLHTNGAGFWSTKAAAVRVTEIRLVIWDSEPKFGELCVHFNTNDWRPDRDGLIYTDPLFETELIEYLNKIDLAGDDVGYSEQGMQSDNYVSFDVGKEFIDSWAKMYPENFQELLDELEE